MDGKIINKKYMEGEMKIMPVKPLDKITSSEGSTYILTKEGHTVHKDSINPFIERGLKELAWKQSEDNDKLYNEFRDDLAKEVAPEYEEWLSKNNKMEDNGINYMHKLGENGYTISKNNKTENKPKYDRITNLTSSYFQEGDTASTGDQCLELSTEDGGDGTYFVLKTDRWAFDSLEELSDLIQDFINTQKAIENGNN